MAAARTSCLWMLALGACVALAMGADCGKECALCVYRLLGQQATLTSLTCSLECEGGLDSRMLRLCRDTLLEDENQNILDDDPGQGQQEQEVVGGMTSEDEDATSPQHQLAKKYGGFMKRYGGFMSRRSPSASSSSSSSQQGALESPGNQEDEEHVRMAILKVLNAEADHNAGEAAKRYGGFMRRAGGAGGEGEVQGDLLEAVLGRGLKKRYGGFMRRIGRPEWLVEDAKNGGTGGVLKRAWEDGSEIQKRYGGFMD